MISDIRYDIIIVVIVQPYCTVVGRRHQHVGSNLLCAVICKIMWLQFLSRSSLHCLTGLHGRFVVFREHCCSRITVVYVDAVWTAPWVLADTTYDSRISPFCFSFLEIFLSIITPSTFRYAFAPACIMCCTTTSTRPFSYIVPPCTAPTIVVFLSHYP